MAYCPATAQKNKNDRMAESHTVIGRYEITRQEMSNFDFMDILCFYWGWAFFDKLYKYNNAPDMAIPPLGRQIQNIRRRFFISNRRSSSRIVSTSTKRSRKCNGFIFHLLADSFYIFISAPAADGMNRLPSFGRCRYKTAVCFVDWMVYNNIASPLSREPIKRTFTPYYK